MARESSNPLVLVAAGAVVAVLLLLGLPRFTAHAIVAPVHEEVENALTAGNSLPPEAAARALALYGAARDHFAEAVVRAPSRSFDWVLLARAELALGADAASLEPGLRLAYLTGPYEASSMLMRSNLVLTHWEAFSPGMRDIARADLERLWQTHGLRAPLFGAYLQWGYRERILFREIALSDPAQARRFDRHFMRWLQSPGPG